MERIISRRSSLLAALAVFLGLCMPGCEARKKQVGTLKEWIVGEWVRTDDHTVWTFKANGEVETSGALPVIGRYTPVEPRTVKVQVSGGSAITSSLQLGVKTDDRGNLNMEFVIEDDQMKPVGINSDVVFRKR